MASEAPATRRAMFARLLRDRVGFVIVMVALLLVVLIGFGGLAAETGLWYVIKRVNQTAADTAALSGAFEKLAGQPYSDMCGFAKRDAARIGFVFASYTCPVSTPACSSPASGQMCANNPPVLGGPGVVGNDNAFEVILAQNQNSLLASPYLPSVTIDTRAVALISKLDDACLLALSPTLPDAIFIKGNPTLNMPNCSIVSDSNRPDAIHLQGSASVTADTLRSHGGITQTGGAPSINLNLPAQTNAPVLPDPYTPGTCTTLCLTHSFLTTGMPAACAVPTVVAGVTRYASNSKICGGLDDKNLTIDLAPGTYWITDGDLNLDTNGTLECTLCNPNTGVGVTIILTIGNGTKVGTVTGKSSSIVGTPTAPNFNAPNSGTFKGLLIVQDSNSLPPGTTFTSTSSQFQGGPSAILDGLVYFPKSDMTFNGNPSVGGSGCLLLVVNTLTLSGDSNLNSTGCVANGVSPPAVKTVALTE